MVKPGSYMCYILFGFYYVLQLQARNTSASETRCYTSNRPGNLSSVLRWQSLWLSTFDHGTHISFCFVLMMSWAELLKSIIQWYNYVRVYTVPVPYINVLNSIQLLSFFVQCFLMDGWMFATILPPTNNLKIETFWWNSTHWNWSQETETNKFP